MSFINKNPYFPELISRELKNAGMEEVTEDAEKVYYCDISYGKRHHPDYKKCQIVNQLSSVDLLGNKKFQYHHHLKYYKQRPQYLPYTVSFTRDNIDEVQNIFVQNSGERRLKYVIKPENGLARGGVSVIRNHLELIRHLGENEKHKDWILQEYIENPLLLKGKKFHFRVYVIFIQTPEWQAVYIGKKGFMYTANKQFRSDTIDKDVVLSGESSRENVYYTPEDFVREYGKQVWDKKIYPQFVKICKETIRSTLDEMKCPTEKQKCFKILGYDILVDKDMKCYLAEINARNVSYKYPNEKFKKIFYKYILKLVLAKNALTNKQLKERNIPYERILYQYDGNVIEGFNGNIKDYERINVSFVNRNWGYIFPFILILLFLCVIIILR